MDNSNRLAEEFSEIVNNIVDLRNKSNHPLALKYSEIFNVAMVDATIEDGRILPFFNLHSNAPFYLAALAGVKYDDEAASLQAVERSLKHFYNDFQPKTINDWFSLQSKDSKAELPPWAAILPWRARSAKSFKQIIEEGTVKDNEKDGLKGGIELGWAYCGPVSDQKLKVEARRICNLIYSIRKQGYQRSFEKDGDIVATALIDKNNHWKWLVTNGYHRACVLAAMGFQTIPIRINLIVSVTELEYWPHVLDGFYTKEEAEQIFNSIFNF